MEVGGKRQKLTAKEALQFKTYQDALDGKIAAVRKVLKWIDEREAAKNKLTVRPINLPIIEGENQNGVPVDDALLLLGIAVEDEAASKGDRPYLRIQSWAVQAALHRFDVTLQRGDLAEFRRHTDHPEQVFWPKETGNG
ncbi:hypothetical protein WP12_18370 [Sphingomonas sp. SRS2]|nr:hypothetical protein WP12_18370 [Sphingomonas sp. SRS2]